MCYDDNDWRLSFVPSGGFRGHLTLLFVLPSCWIPGHDMKLQVRLNAKQRAGTRQTPHDYNAQKQIAHAHCYCVYSVLWFEEKDLARRLRVSPPCAIISCPLNGWMNQQLLNAARPRPSTPQQWGARYYETPGNSCTQTRREWREQITQNTPYARYK